MADKIKYSIIDGAKYALEQVQTSYSLDGDRPLEVWQDEVQKFLSYWDKVFLYGLKSVKKGYWNFVSSLSHPSLVNEVKDTPGAVNDLTRSRVWLASILNDNELENYLVIIRSEAKGLLQKYYRPNAIVRSPSLMDDLISIACGQEATIFSIHMDYICYRSNEIFVGPGNTSAYGKIFDVKFNWDESIRTRSSSVYSVRSIRSFIDKPYEQGTLRSRYNTRTYHDDGADDIGVNAEYLQKIPTPSPTPSPRECTIIEEDIGTYEEHEITQDDVIRYTVSSARNNPFNDPELSQENQSSDPEQSHQPLKPPSLFSQAPNEFIVKLTDRSPQSSHNTSPQPSRTSSVGSEPQYPLGPASAPSYPPLMVGLSSLDSSLNVSLISVNRDDSVLSSSPVTSLKRKKLKLAKIDSVSTNITCADPVIDTAVIFNDSLMELHSDRDVDDPGELVEVLQTVEIEEHSPQSGVMASSKVDVTSRDSSPVGSPKQGSTPSCEESSSEIENRVELNTNPYSDEEVTNENTIPVEEMMRPPSPVPVYESSAGSSYSSLSDKSCVSDVELLEDHAKPTAPFVLFNERGAVGTVQSSRISPTDPYEEPDTVMPYQSAVPDPYARSDDPYSGSDDDVVERDHAMLNVDKERSISPVRGSSFNAGNTVEMDHSIETEISHASIELSLSKEAVNLYDDISDEELPGTPPEPSGTPPGPSGGTSWKENAPSQLAGTPKQLLTKPSLATIQGQQPAPRPSSSDHHIPKFSAVSLDRDQAVVVPSDNRKIKWTMNLFLDEESFRVMYRIWLKDEVGNLEVSYLLVTNITAYLLDFDYIVKLRVPLNSTSYGRGLNWQVITLFYVVEDGTTAQVDLITGCEAISRGIMEGFSVHADFPLTWCTDESYSQQRLKYHIGTFLQTQQEFNMESIDGLYYSIASWTPLKGDTVPTANYPMTQGILGLKEPTMFSYIWRDYYFILDNGKLSQFDTECSGVIKKEYTVIGSSGCRKMQPNETSKHHAFKFVSEEGDEVMLNCKDRKDKEKWMGAICEIAMEIPRAVATGKGEGPLITKQNRLQCSVVISDDYLIVVREGLKTAFTLQATHIKEITSVSWYPNEEFCVISIDEAKRVWLILFRDNYETNKFMETLWDQWSELYQLKDGSMLFRRLTEDATTPAPTPFEEEGERLPSGSLLSRAREALQDFKETTTRHPSRLSF